MSTPQRVLNNRQLPPLSNITVKENAQPQPMAGVNAIGQQSVPLKSNSHGSHEAGQQQHDAASIAKYTQLYNAGGATHANQLQKRGKNLMRNKQNGENSDYNMLNMLLADHPNIVDNFILKRMSIRHLHRLYEKKKEIAMHEKLIAFEDESRQMNSFVIKSTNPNQHVKHPKGGIATKQKLAKKPEEKKPMLSPMIEHFSAHADLDGAITRQFQFNPGTSSRYDENSLLVHETNHSAIVDGNTTRTNAKSIDAVENPAAPTTGNTFETDVPVSSSQPHNSIGLRHSSSLSRRGALGQFLASNGSPSVSRLTTPKNSAASIFEILHQSTAQCSMTEQIIEILTELKQTIGNIITSDGANLYVINESETELQYFDDSKKDSLHSSSNIDFKSTALTFPIKIGTSVAAYVASTKKSMFVKDICGDERFIDGIPMMGGTAVKSVICIPLLTHQNQILGVLEMWRRPQLSPFTCKHLKIAVDIAKWANVAIYHIQEHQRNRKNQRLHEFILQVTQSIFEKFKNMDYVIKDIMKNAKNLVNAERVSLFMVDEKSQELYASVFDTGSSTECQFVSLSKQIRFPLSRGIAGNVAITGETLNINDVYSDDRFNREIDSETGFKTKNLLCMPVTVQNEVIGVMQMLNKVDGCFTKEDEHHFKLFAVYCGLALHISRMYEKIRRSEQKYKVALQVLSYHSQCNESDVTQLLSQQPTNDQIVNIPSFFFSPWSLSETGKPMMAIHMFYDIVQSHNKSITATSHQNDAIKFEVDSFDRTDVARFILTVRKNYRSVPYHNWAHAFSVAHAMYSLLKNCKNQYTLIEKLALFVGCMCHDLDHRGKTNQFMMQTADPLNSLYASSTMERHHFNMTVTILQRQGHNIFKHFDSSSYKVVLGNIKHCILSTDLSNFFAYKEEFSRQLEKQSFNWDVEHDRLMSMAISMTTSDLCSMFKPWGIQLTLIMVIMEEFWLQGDEEKLQGQTPIRMMDRNYQDELPEGQVGFLRMTCIPCYTLLSKIFHETTVIKEAAEKNLLKWKEMASKPLSERSNIMCELKKNVQEFIRKYEICMT